MNGKEVVKELVFEILNEVLAALEARVAKLEGTPPAVQQTQSPPEMKPVSVPQTGSTQS